MIELGQLVPQILVAVVIVGMSLVLLRAVRKMSGNGKIEALGERLDSIDTRLGEVEDHLTYLRGVADGAADATGRNRALTLAGETK